MELLVVQCHVNGALFSIVGVKQCPEANRLSLRKNSTVVKFLCLVLYFASTWLSMGQNAPVGDKMAYYFEGLAILLQDGGSLNRKPAKVGGGAFCP